MGLDLSTAQMACDEFLRSAERCLDSGRVLQARDALISAARVLETRAAHELATEREAVHRMRRRLLRESIRQNAHSFVGTHRAIHRPTT